METHEHPAEAQARQKVVQVELVIQTRQKDTDSWRDQGKPFPALFEQAAFDYLRLIRTGYPGLRSQLIERSVIHSERVVEA